MNQKDPLPPEPVPETEYEKWFREQVEAAIIEADDPNCVWIPHEVVVEQMRKEIAALDALIAAGYKNAAELDSPRDPSPPEGDPLRRPT